MPWTSCASQHDRSLSDASSALCRITWRPLRRHRRRGAATRRQLLHSGSPVPSERLRWRARIGGCGWSGASRRPLALFGRGAGAIEPRYGNGVRRAPIVRLIKKPASGSTEAPPPKRSGETVHAGLCANPNREDGSVRTARLESPRELRRSMSESGVPMRSGQVEREECTNSARRVIQFSGWVRKKLRIVLHGVTGRACAASGQDVKLGNVRMHSLAQRAPDPNDPDPLRARAARLQPVSDVASELCAVTRYGPRSH